MKKTLIYRNATWEVPVFSRCERANGYSHVNATYCRCALQIQFDSDIGTLLQIYC